MRVLIRCLRWRFQVIGGIGIKCYSIALVSFDSTIMCLLLKLGAKVQSRGIEFTGRSAFGIKKSKKIKVLPPPVAHRAAPISVSVALGHTYANAVKATAGCWSTGSFVCLTFPLHSLIPSARREGSEYHFYGLWYDSAGARTYQL